VFGKEIHKILQPYKAKTCKVPYRHAKKERYKRWQDKKSAVYYNQRDKKAQGIYAFLFFNPNFLHNAPRV
jgi:hypothetical protein